MKCFSCAGKGESLAFISYKPGYSGPPVAVSKCPQCNGSGELDNAAWDWIKRGRLLRQRRLAVKMNMLEAAKLHGVSLVELSKIESGKVDNLQIDWRYE